MTRPTDWHVLDLSGDPTPGDPARLRQLASRFHDFAETAHRAKLAVESLQGDGALLAWVGKSGDAFREQFGDFPNQVNKLYRSHLMVGDALDAFAPTLETAQAQADRALADGKVAAEKLASLRGALSVAETDFTGASRAAEAAQAETVKPDPDQVKQAVRDASAAQQRVSAAQGQVNGAQGELDLAKQLAQQAKEMRDGASRSCVREIEDASDAGIQPRNFWQKLGDAFKEIWNIICEVAKWVALVAGIIGMIIGGPLAWIALAAGAILLIKAIVDYSQGKGSVMDLVFGILGIIPGVKGLTSLSKLSALYKAGGMKEIGKAALTGMKNMAKGMVDIVKAAGQGAVTIGKALGDGSAAALAGIKNAGTVVTGAIQTGKVGDFIPAGLTKGAGGPGFGALPMPHLPPVSITSGKTFRQHFNDLAAVKTQTQNTHITAIKNDFAGKVQADKLKIEGVHAADLQVKVNKINADAAAKLNTDKLAIENAFKADLKVQADRAKIDAAADLSIRKNDIDTDFAAQGATKLGEIKAASDAKFTADELAINKASTERGVQIDADLKNVTDQAAEINRIAQTPQAQADMARFNQVYGGAMNHLNLEHTRLTTEKADLPANLASDLNTLKVDTATTLADDQAAALRDLDVKKLESIASAEKQSAADVKVEIENLTKNLEQQRDLDVQNLTNQIENTRLADIKTAETQVDAAKNLELNTSFQSFQQAEQTEIATFTQHMDQQYDIAHGALNNHLLDGMSESVSIPGGTVNVLHLGKSGVDPGDFSLVIEKNLPKLDQINPNKLPTDVNCTICVQRVDDYIKNDTITVAHKLPSTQPLNTIEANYPGMKFSQVPNADYSAVVADMATLPSGSVGIIGYKLGASSDGHVMNVVNVGGRVMFVDGQTGKLGSLPNLTGLGDELHYTRIP